MHMDLTIPRSNIYTATSLIKFSLGFIVLILSFTTQATNGPSVNELSESLDSTWNTLLKITNCNRPPPQESICMQEHNGKTITVKLFGQPVNALILFETFTTANVSGPVVTQQTGFLIGPISGYAYKVINEQQAHGLYNTRRITDNGLKVFAHPVSGQTISPQGIELNKGKNWLDGKYEPWIQHWTALSRTREALKNVKRYLELNY